MGGKKFKYWILTIPENDWSPAKPDSVDYIRGQLECGRSGYRHWQIMVCFSRRVSLKSAKNSFPRTSHLEPTRSDAAREYVWKEDTRIGDPFEFGSLPVRRNDPEDWDAIWDAAVRGDILAIPSDIRIRHYGSFRRIAQDNLRPVAMDRTCTVLWGKTGVGKTHRAWGEAGHDAYIKDPRTKWFDGYRGQENVIIDEFRGTIDVSHLLRWLDCYPVLVEAKGTSMVWNAKKIWITSNLHPREWYPDLDESTRDALFRRLRIIEIKKFPPYVNNFKSSK